MGDNFVDSIVGLSWGHGRYVPSHLSQFQVASVQHFVGLFYPAFRTNEPKRTGERAKDHAIWNFMERSHHADRLAVGQCAER